MLPSKLLLSVSGHIKLLGLISAYFINKYQLAEIVRDEVEYFLDNGFDIESEYDCYTMTLIIDSMEGEAQPIIEQYRNKKQEKKNSNFYKLLHKLGRKILDEMDKRKR